ncbi:MAG: hypothetical protein M3Z04_13065 [Chloroflexota bacterium]|nr:hypothetical protein [Chloroflexota bacterium]
MAVRRDQLAKIVVGAAGWVLIIPPVARFSDVPPGSTFYYLRSKLPPPTAS